MPGFSRRLHRRLAVLLTDLAIAAVDASARRLERFGRGLDSRAWRLANLQAARWAEDWAAQLVRAITESTRQQIRDLVGRAIREGWSTEELAQAIEARGIFSRHRAQLIAITETTRSFAVANAIAWQAARVERARWYTAADDRVCPICESRAGKSVPLLPSGSFDSPLPPAHPGCRCYLQPEV